MAIHYTHPKDCPCRKAAAADRAKHDAAARVREARQQVFAHTMWVGAEVKK